ncbi:MAG: histidine--tRNA ligase [Gemmatimonadota bacterium]
MSRIAPLKGMRDFYPDAMRVRRWMASRWRDVAERFGFEEVDAPLLEPLELYTRKSGDEIAGQLYVFEDRGGRAVALRPEMTPSLARMVAARSQGLPKPIRWYSIPRLFRYERPQRGRLREFFQLNLDILGVPGIEADAEIIAAGVDVLRACGLEADDFAVRYSDRRLLDAVLDGLGLAAESHPAVFAALDRLPRSGPGEGAAALTRLGVDGPTAAVLLEATGARDLAALQRALAPRGIDLTEAAGRLDQLATYLTAYGVGGYCAFDPGIVRGLAYYTGVVFEMHDRAGALRALCGGGRYDDLLAAFGGEPLPAVGFGLGDAVLQELLTARGRLPAPGPALDAYVAPLAPSDRAAAIAVAGRLRDAGLRTDLALIDQSRARHHKRAEAVGARVAVLVGGETPTGQVAVRALATGKETVGPLEALIASLRHTPPC